MLDQVGENPENDGAGDHIRGRASLTNLRRRIARLTPTRIPRPRRTWSVGQDRADEGARDHDRGRASLTNLDPAQTPTARPLEAPPSIKRLVSEICPGG